MDWIVHLDTDELLHPAGASEYSLRNLLSDVPSEVDVVVFSNYVRLLIPSGIFLLLISYQNEEYIFW